MAYIWVVEMKRRPVPFRRDRPRWLAWSPFFITKSGANTAKREWAAANRDDKFRVVKYARVEPVTNMPRSGK